jgi:hypothetical protein
LDAAALIRHQLRFEARAVPKQRKRG